MRCNLAFVVLALILLGCVSALSLSEFTDGSTNFNETLNSSVNVSKFLSLPVGAWNINYTFNIIGYSLYDLTGGATYYYLVPNSNNVTTYAGYWNGSALPINGPANSDDGDWTSGSYYHSTGSWQSVQYYANFTIRHQIYSANVTYLYYFSGAGDITLYCKDKTLGTWGVVSNNTVTGTINKTDVINASCLSNSSELVELKYDYRTINAGFFLEQELHTITGTSGITYPTNLTIRVDQTQIYNNASYINGSAVANASKQYNGVDTPRITFYVNNTNLTVLELTSFNVQYNLNQTYEFKSEMNTTGVITSNMILYRTYLTGQNSYQTTTGRVTTSALNESGIVDLYYYDVLGFYPKRHYYYYNDLTAIQNYSLYVGNTTNLTQTLFTLYQTTGYPLSGAYVAVYKKVVSLNDYIIVEMHKTDENGQCVMNLEYLGSEYKIVVRDQDFEVIYSTQPTQIKSNSLTLTISLEDDYFSSLGKVNDIGYGGIQHNNETNVLSVSYTGDGLINYTTFKVVYRTNYGDISVCENVTYASTATVYCKLPYNDTGVYYASFTVDTIYQHSPLLMEGSYFYAQDAVTPAMGKTGLLMWAIIIIFFSLIGIMISGGNPSIVIVFALVGVLMGFPLHISKLAIGSVITMVILGGLILFRLRT